MVMVMWEFLLLGEGREGGGEEGGVMRGFEGWGRGG